MIRTSPRGPESLSSSPLAVSHVEPPASRARRPLRLAAAALVLLALAGCSRCGKEATPGAGAAATELTRLVPRDIEAAVVVPDLGALGERLTLIENLKIASFAAQLQGLPSAKAWVNAFVQQLGVDPRSREALEKAGLAPSRGLAVVVTHQGDVYSLVGVKDAKAWEETLTGLAKKRLGAGVVEASDEGGRRKVSFLRAQGSPPVLAMQVSSGFAFMATGASAARLDQAVKLDPKSSLAFDARFSEGMGRLEGEKDLWVFLPQGSLVGRKFQAAGALLSARLQKDALTVRGDLPWMGQKDALALLEVKAPAAPLAEKLPAKTFAAVRYAGDPAKLGPHWHKLVGPYVAKAVRESGFPFEKDVLENLQPGIVAGLALAPAPPLGYGLPQLDIRRTNPFRYVHLTALAKVKDAAKAKSTLDGVPALAKRFGATLTPEERAGQRVFLTSYAQGEGVHLALQGDTVVMASPVSRLEEALGGTGQGGVATTLAPSLVATRPLTLVVDLQRLAQSVKDLPAEAWGIGGFAIKATTVRWLEATDDLRAITGAVWQKDGAVQAELTLQLGAPAP